MKTKIDEKLCDSKNLVLLVEMKDRDENNRGRTFNFRYRLKIKGDKYKGINGIIENLGMSSSDILDDEDATQYEEQAERDSIDLIENYLKNKFPNSKIKGAIKSTLTSIYKSKPSEYNIKI